MSEIDELKTKIKELEKKNKALWLEKTNHILDAEYVEDNAFDFAVANELFYGFETRKMLARFVEDNYGLKPIKDVKDN
jgi:hypothetical protein